MPRNAIKGLKAQNTKKEKERNAGEETFLRSDAHALYLLYNQFSVDRICLPSKNEFIETERVLFQE
ncbi:hypothetical protein X975_09601, partial [Stegodyphus mimosarum]